MMVLCLALLLLVQLSDGGRILFLNSWHSKSHARTMMGLAKRLSSRGHEVTMFNQAFFPFAKDEGKVKMEFSIVPPASVGADPALVADLFWNKEMVPYEYWIPNWFSYKFLEQSLNSTVLSTLLGTPYDIAFVDELFTASTGAIALSLRKRHGTKITIFATTEMSDMFAQQRGLSRNPVVVANQFVKGYNLNYEPDKFFYRLKNGLEAAIEFIMSHPADWIQRAAGWLLNVESSFENLYKTSVLTVTDFPRYFRTPSCTANNIVPVGESCDVPSPLPDDLGDFLEAPQSKGTIYIAFGSIVQWDSGPKGLPETFIRVFNRLTEYRVVWAYNGRPLKDEAGLHVRVLKWAPQRDILAHPSTAVFFTHGGIKSLKEGICSSVPMLVLPFFADQALIAVSAKNQGIADSIYKKNLTEANIEARLRSVLDQREELQRGVEKYRRYFRDVPRDPLDVGVQRVERVLRLPEEAILKYESIRSTDWISFLYLDVASLLILAVCVLSL